MHFFTLGWNRGRSYQLFISNKLDLTFRASNHCAKFRQNRIKNCGRRSVYRQTDRMKDRRKWLYGPHSCIWGPPTF